MLGVGDFYYELGVQIIEVCLALKHRNGGEGGSVLDWALGFSEREKILKDDLSYPAVCRPVRS